MSTTDRLLKLAVSSVFALGATATTSAVLAQEPEKEQCAGIIKAFNNDCATSMNACHGHSEIDASTEAWIYLSKGTCQKLAGARIVMVNDPTPKQN